MPLRKTLIGILPCVTVLFGQNTGANLGAASLGLIYDSAKGVSPVLGIPGAATISKPLAIGVDLSSVAVPPREDFVIGTKAGDSTVYLVKLRGRSTDPQLLAGVKPAPDRIEFSPSGASAALYYATDQNVSLVSGLPGNPSVRHVDVSIVGSRLTSLAVSDSGLLVVGAPSGEAGAVWIESRGTLRRFGGLREATSIAFTPGTNTAYIADRKQSAVFRLQASWGELALAAGKADGIAEPASIAVSAESGRVLVTNPVARTVVAVDMNTGERMALECACIPTGLHRLIGSTFRLTEVQAGVAWLLDAEPRSPRIVFVATEQVKTVVPR